MVAHVPFIATLAGGFKLRPVPNSEFQSCRMRNSGEVLRVWRLLRPCILEHKIRPFPAQESYSNPKAGGSVLIFREGSSSQGRFYTQKDGDMISG